MVGNEVNLEVHDVADRVGLHLCGVVGVGEAAALEEVAGGGGAAVHDCEGVFDLW